MDPSDALEPVIGLEIHLELCTKSKLFSPARNRFGDEPNSNISFICTGQPGTLPLLNEEAVRMAVRFGLAIGANIARTSTFDRKSYFYPDSPRNFQITQFYHPLLIGGGVSIQIEGKERKIAIRSTHLEDDAGSLKHFTSFTGVDYNRAGVPLIEIVSEPCLKSAKEASLYAQAVRSIARYLQISDGNMEEGSLRIDANISLRSNSEEELRTKSEIKNINSFNNLEAAIESEILRQRNIYRNGGTVSQATFRFDGQKKRLTKLRTKEGSHDYRYLPEPDLLPLILEESFIEEERKSLPELPQAKIQRYIETLGLKEAMAQSIAIDPLLARYFEDALLTTNYPDLLASWIVVEFAGRLNPKGIALYKSAIPPSLIAQLVDLLGKGRLTGPSAKAIADTIIDDPTIDLEKLIASNPSFTKLDDETILLPIVKEVLAMEPQTILDYRNGREKALRALVGKVMQRTQGRADPKIVTQLLLRSMEE